VAEGLDAGRAVRSGIRASLLEMVEDSERDRAELTKERDAALARAVVMGTEDPELNITPEEARARLAVLRGDAALAEVAKLREELANVKALSMEHMNAAQNRNGERIAMQQERDAALAQLAAVKRELGEAYANSERLQAELDGAAHRAEKAEAQLAERTRERDEARALLREVLRRARPFLSSWHPNDLAEIDAALAPEPAKEVDRG